MSLKDTVAQNNAAFEKAFNSKDAKAVSLLYTKDGQLAPPGTNGTIFRGHSEIQKFWQGALDAGLTDIKLTIDELVQKDDVLVEFSHYKHNKGQGAYVVVWKKEDGVWKMWRDIFNA